MYTFGSLQHYSNSSYCNNQNGQVNSIIIMQRQREERERAIQQPRNLVFPPEATNCVYKNSKRFCNGANSVRMRKMKDCAYSNRYRRMSVSMCHIITSHITYWYTVHVMGLSLTRKHNKSINNNELIAQP
jgi:hypothetical protein